MQTIFPRDVKDRVVEYPKRAELVNVVTGLPLGTFDITRVPGVVSEVGTAVNKAYLQPLENGISELADAIVTNTLSDLNLYALMAFRLDFLPIYGGLGNFEGFDNTNNVNLTETTATVNTTLMKSVFTGTQKLTMKPETFVDTYDRIVLNVHADYKKAKVVEVTDSTHIKTSGTYPLTTDDKLVVDDVEVGILAVAGGQTDTTYATEITNANNNTSGKNAVQFNGLRHFVVSEASGLKLYRGDDDTNKTLVATISTDVTTKFSVDTALINGNEFLYVTWGTTTQQKIKGYDISYAVVQAELVVDTITSILETNIFIEGNVLMFANNGVSSTYPLSDNIRGGTYTIATNGSLSVAITLELLTEWTNAVLDAQNISVGIYQGKPYIVFRFINTATQIAYIIMRGGLTPTGGIKSNWGLSTVVAGSTTFKIINSIKKTVNSNVDRLIVAITENNVLYHVYSDNGGVSWTKSSSLDTGSNPQLTENLQGDIHITYEDGGTIKTIRIPNGTTTPEASKNLATGTNPRTDGKATDYIKPICTYQNGTIVKTAGQEIIGTAFNLTLASPQTLLVSDQLPISTQYKIKNLQGTINDLIFKQATQEYLSYELKMDEMIDTTEIEITGKDTEIDYFYYGII